MTVVPSAIGLVASDLPRTLAFYRAIGLDIPTDADSEAHVEVTVTGGLLNPLGAKALYLGNTIYRIHGTNNDRTIGRASSSGCFRMMNEHVTHLATLAQVGTTVRVVPNYTGVSTSAPLASLFSGFGAAEEPTAKPAKKIKSN